jgi:hypothetical protein
MSTITDEEMRQRIAGTRQYSVVILKHGPNKQMEGADKIIWEHGRRNFQLRADGVMPIVCPINDGSNVSGIGFKNMPEDWSPWQVFTENSCTHYQDHLPDLRAWVNGG